MKYLILLVLLTGCESDDVYTWLQIAKYNAPQKVCTNITSDVNPKINGYYCLIYEGPIK